MLVGTGSTEGRGTVLLGGVGDETIVSGTTNPPGVTPIGGEAVCISEVLLSAKSIFDLLIHPTTPSHEASAVEPISRKSTKVSPAMYIN